MSSIKSLLWIGRMVLGVIHTNNSNISDSTLVCSPWDGNGGHGGQSIFSILHEWIESILGKPLPKRVVSVRVSVPRVLQVQVELRRHLWIHRRRRLSPAKPASGGHFQRRVHSCLCFQQVSRGSCHEAVPELKTIGIHDGMDQHCSLEYLNKLFKKQIKCIRCYISTRLYIFMVPIVAKSY